MYLDEICVCPSTYVIMFEFQTPYKLALDYSEEAVH